MLWVVRPLVQFLLTLSLLFGFASLAATKQELSKSDEARLKPACRFDRGGWVYVHLEGSPAEHGISAWLSAGTGDRRRFQKPCN
jgi:hypothetical protein